MQYSQPGYSSYLTTNLGVYLEEERKKKKKEEKNPLVFTQVDLLSLARWRIYRKGIRMAEEKDPTIQTVKSEHI